MKLELTQKLQQQQILAPQMILSMDILLLPTLDLEQRIEQEFVSNPALEIVESEETPDVPKSERSESESNESPPFDRVESYASSAQLDYDPVRRRPASDRDPKHEALQNTEGKPPGLKDSLIQQLHLQDLDCRVLSIAEDIVNSLDHRGYLLGSVEELRSAIAGPPSADDMERALQAVRSLDPAGVAAENLQECLLLQLQRDPQDYPLETEIIREHLEDLALNKVPKIARDLGRTVEDIKEAIEIISALDPAPGGRLESEPTMYVRPDVTVEEVEGELQVQVENQTIPKLQVSAQCRDLLKVSRGNDGVSDFLRRKIESAQWLIHAVQQRQRTLHEIATAIVEYQRDFFIEGPEYLKALKMQTIADKVGVHISTISRAIKGKYMSTPQGLFEMRFFFTGGVSNERGEVESRRIVHRRISEIIEGEDKSSPLSDTQIAAILRQQGLSIARRTVTKYREQRGIPSSRLRKVY